ncbi:hypothetical protein [Xylanibacter brevis]|uniref:hypothetical protein n=1 Tax=Xylanibacter brevis TaxID=83231 RepID=UPI0012DEFD62|nr:hypothetical protein [Xylanibacter brevis]
MELPKIKLEQLELEHEVILATIYFHLKSRLSMRYKISKATAPAMPNLGKGTECIKLLLSQASKVMRKPLLLITNSSFLSISRCEREEGFIAKVTH